MKKLHLLGLLTILFTIGTILGTLTPPIIQQAVAKKPTEPSYAIQLQNLNGEPLVDFNWGDFVNGQSKELDCKLEYLGNMPTKVKWNALDLSTDWKLEVWDQSHKKPKQWEQNSIITFLPETIRNITIILTENNATSNHPYSFNLNFETIGNTKKK